MRYIDLSVTLENDKSWAPWWARNKINYQNHKFGALAIYLIFRLTAKYLRGGLGWANEIIKISTHGTTHLDAPWHYAPTTAGQPARTIDEMPLEWCFNDGIVLDMRHKGDSEAVTVADLQTALRKVHYTIKPFDIVLIQTGNDRLLGSPAYFTQGSGVSAEATHWLIDQGVKVMGIDAWGWDIPLPTQAKLAKQAKRDDVFWAAHYVGLDKEYYQIERLCGLDQLPPFGFKICCFPLKVKNGSAGPSRVVAILED